MFRLGVVVPEALHHFPCQQPANSIGACCQPSYEFVGCEIDQDEMLDVRTAVPSSPKGR
jgi:hypothetical protein